MKWIDQFAEGTFSLFAGHVIEGLQPLDFFNFFPLWYDLWIRETAHVIRKLDLEKKNFQEIKHLLPSPSNMRLILVKIIITYHGFQEKNIDDCRLVTTFFARMLLESCPKDPFALLSNPFHTPAQVDDLLKNIKWIEADSKIARKIGQLITAAGSLVHGLYNDVVTDFGWDVYGPYNVNYNNSEHSFLIRHFPDLRPQELWDEKYLASGREILIYAVYEDVQWRIATVGCHTISTSGTPFEGMKAFCVTIDGRTLSPAEIQILIDELCVKAESIYREIHTMSFEDLKEKVMLQECYQLKSLFEAASTDWKPTEEMRKRIQGKPLVNSTLPQGKMMTTVDEYKELFGINGFAQEVLREKV